MSGRAGGQVSGVGCHLTFTFCWSDVAKMSCILGHLDVQLILAYSWARPAILVAGKVEGDVLFSSVSSFSFLFSFFPIPLFPFISSTISSIFFLPFSETTQNDLQGLTFC